FSCSSLLLVFCHTNTHTNKHTHTLAPPPHHHRRRWSPVRSLPPQPSRIDKNTVLQAHSNTNTHTQARTLWAESSRRILIGQREGTLLPAGKTCQRGRHT